MPRFAFGRLAAAKDGLRERCKACANAEARSRYTNDTAYRNYRIAKSKEYREANPEQSAATMRAYRLRNAARLQISKRNGRLKRKYDLTPEALEAMKEQQNYRCAVCGRERELVVDHDHISGRVRGLLCNGCNAAIGNLGDDIAGVTLALRYLKRSGGHF